MKQFFIILTLTFSLMQIKSFGVLKKDYFSSISEVWKSKNYKKGIIVLNQALAEYPGEMKFYYHLCFFYQYNKSFQKAYVIGKKGYGLFKNNREMIHAYKNAILNYGWRLYQSRQTGKAFALFTEAYLVDENDQWVLNAYGVTLREQKKYLKAVEVLGKGHRTYPKNPYLGDNLSWTYWAMGENELAANRRRQAYVYYEKAYQVHSKKKPDMAVSYIYKLIYFKKWQEADNVLKSAEENFKKEKSKFFEVKFWLGFNRAKEAFEKKNYIEMILLYKKLYRQALKKDKIWKGKTTLSELVILNLNFRIMDIVSGLCPYYKKLKHHERETLLKYFEILKRELHANLYFIRLRLAGHILYRSNAIRDARQELDRAYQSFIKSSFGQKHLREVKIEFPMKGFYYVGGNESSKAITHMGLNRYCYDITGADKNGRTVKPGKSGKKVNHYYGFGKKIYSPVEGVVSNFEGHHPDDPIGETPYRAKGNHLQIKSDGLIYHFVHLKQGSIVVQKGQRVRKGQLIARLGNSSSSIPHLHFCVYSGDWMVSLPLRFTRYRSIKNRKQRLVKNGRPGGVDGFDLIKIR